MYNTIKEVINNLQSNDRNGTYMELLTVNTEQVYYELEEIILQQMKEYKEDRELYNFYFEQLELLYETDLKLVLEYKTMTKEIQTEKGTFKLALITDRNTYYVNMQEANEEDSVLLYDNEGNFINDNYLAAHDYINAMYEVLASEIIPEYVDDEMLKLAKGVFVE